MYLYCSDCDVKVTIMWIKFEEKKIKINVNYVFYRNIDQILSNKLQGPMHYKIGVTCVYNGYVF